MDYKYEMGRIATLFVYIVESLVTLVIAIINKNISTEMLLMALGVWIVSLVALLIIPSTSNKSKHIFKVSQMLATIAMSICLVMVLDNWDILLILLFLQWMSNLMFLRNSVSTYLLLFHVTLLACFTFLVKHYSVYEFIIVVIVLFCAKWFVNHMNAIISKQEKLNRDQQQSLDDMLALVEVKYEEARTANKAKSSFLANMSHEIRTPINTVLGLDTMILRESKDDEIRKYAFNIQTAGQSLLSIINDILDFSKIESGKMEIIPVDYDFASLVNDVMNMIKPKSTDKGLGFNVCVDSMIPSRMYGDDVRIRQVLVNLLTNAVKYTHEGEVSMSIKSEMIGENVKLYFSVKDTGIGIKQEDLASLYKEFVRIEEKRNRNIEGTGLGINIVTNLLNLMGSKLEVDSVYGEGSDFHFAIMQGITNVTPVGNLEERIREQANEYSYEASFIIPDVRLLVVDDNAMNRLVFTELLKDMECVIDEADSGMVCLELVQTNKYDIIFMDHMMPNMDGIETFRCMKEFGDYINKDTPVIILTANAISGARENYLAEGFVDYISKPIDPDKLEKIIGKMIPDNKKKPGLPKEEAKEEVKEATDRVNEEELPEIEGVDYEYALMKLKNISILKNVIDNFSVVAESDIKELEHMYENIQKAEGEELVNAFSEYRIKVHAMKNNAGTMGALGTFALARTLEYGARDMDKSVLDRLMELFAIDWRTLKKNIDDVFGYGQTDDNQSNETIPQELLEQYMQMLSAAMEDLDTDTADAIMEELAQYSYVEEDRKLLDELAVAVRKLQIDESLIIIEKLMNRG